jgi:hypothetical protein
MIDYNDMYNRLWIYILIDLDIGLIVNYQVWIKKRKSTNYYKVKAAYFLKILWNHPSIVLQATDCNRWSIEILNRLSITIAPSRPSVCTWRESRLEIGCYCSECEAINSSVWSRSTHVRCRLAHPNVSQCFSSLHRELLSWKSMLWCLIHVVAVLVQGVHLTRVPPCTALYRPVPPCTALYRRQLELSLSTRLPRP